LFPLPRDYEQLSFVVMKHVMYIVALASIAGCTNEFSGPFAAQTPVGTVVIDGETGQRPLARPATLETAPPPPETARTVEQFDTTTAQDRAEAVAAPKPAGERRLGSTIASLGSPTDPGFWLKTPLVTKITQGRIEYPSNGKTVNVELRPSGGAAGSGSQLSLPAMRLIEAPLTGLLEVVVYAN
jgi:hypothetical protein